MACLIAGHHILRDTLKSDDRIGDERGAPELAVMLAQVVSREDGTRALHGGNGVGACHGRVRSVQISGLYFDVADALFPRQPVLAGE